MRLCAVCGITVALLGFGQIAASVARAYEPLANELTFAGDDTLAAAATELAADEATRMADDDAPPSLFETTTSISVDDAVPVAQVASHAPVASCGGAPCHASPCASCGGSSCSGNCDMCGTCDIVAPYTLIGSFGLDTFRGYSDFDFQDNFGAVLALNAGIPLPIATDHGVHWQLGASYGVYDWRGRDSFTTKFASAQEQAFFTTGFFRRAVADQRLSFGFVYDWMVNSNWGVFADEPFLGQWRGQIEYAFTDTDSIGLWGAMHDRGDSQSDEFGTSHYRPISQINFFWHHKWGRWWDTRWNQLWDSRVWIGFPEGGQEFLGGSLGELILGGDLQIPVTDRCALYAQAQYTLPSARPGPSGSVEYFMNLGVGFAWYFGSGARSHSVNGLSSAPYLPLANNSNFMVDFF